MIAASNAYASCLETAANPGWLDGTVPAAVQTAFNENNGGLKPLAVSIYASSTGLTVDVTSP